jgi:hypothetical protein
MSDKVVLRFSFSARRDVDLLTWLAEQPNRSLVVREALRAWMSQADGLDETMLRRVLREELARVSVLGNAPAGPETSPEDEQVSEVLDSLMGAWADLGADDR